MSSTGQILVVDDDDVIRALLSDILVDADFGVETASDGAQALILCQNQRFDVVMTDINMPHLDGVELLKKIKDSNEQCQVIIMTADATVDTAIDSTRYGAFDYLKKPFEEFDAIVPLVTRALEKARMSKSSEVILKQLVNRASELVQSVSGTSYLIIESKASSSRFFLQTSPLVIGTGSNSIIKDLPPDCLETHVLIKKIGDQWEITPFGPLYVDGQLLKTERILTDGFKMDIAGITVTYRQERDLFNINRAVRALQEDLDKRTEAGTMRLSGQLKNTMLPDLLQVILALDEPGMLKVEGSKGMGEVFFSDGKIVHAKTGELLNAKALFRMSLWSDGDFSFIATDINKEQLLPNVEEDTMLILLETCRQVDEYRQIENQVPDPLLRLGVNVDWLENHVVRSDAEKALLKDIIQYQYADLVISKSTLSDLDAIKTLIRLRQDGAIVVLT